MSICSLLLLSLLVSGDESRAVGPTRYALAIGHNHGTASEEPLRFAEQDAERFLDTVVRLGGVTAGNAVLLRSPNVAGLEAALSRISHAMRAAASQTDALLLFYYAGHGDEGSLHFGDERVLREHLLERLKAMPARVNLVVIDSCRTQAPGRSRGVRAVGDSTVLVMRPASFSGFVVIESTRSGQAAIESDRLGGAVFTHYWLSALSGAGDLDEDGRVTLLEAYAWAYRRTIMHSGQSSTALQHPAFDMDFAGTGELVLTELREATASLRLPVGKEADYLVYQQPSGVLLAQAVTVAGSAVVLAVPPGRLLVQQRMGQRFRAAEIAIAYNGEHTLQDSELRDAPKELVSHRGGPLLLRTSAARVSYVLSVDRVDGVWLVRNGGLLGYAREFRGWQLLGSVALAWSEIERYSHENRYSSLEAALRAGVTLPVTGAALQVAVGPEVRLQHQARRRTDLERLALAGHAVAAEETSLGLSAGVGLETIVQVPLSNEWSAGLGLRCSGIAMRLTAKDKTSPVLVWVIGLGTGVEYRF